MSGKKVFFFRFKNVHEEIKRCIHIKCSTASYKFLDASQLYKYHGANKLEKKY